MNAEISNIYTENVLETLQERVDNIEWIPSRDGSRHVPAIHVHHCRPDLTCQKLSYRDCGHDCTKYPPGQAPNTPDQEGASVDNFPICNPVIIKDDTTQEYIDQTDCAGRPCTCHAMDYTLWEGRQWGEDCSYQFWSPR